jgi:aldehyde:ferredoxin oxidoreductase
MSEKRLGGYAGKILRINLSTGKISTEPTAKRARMWIGGEGLNWSVMFDEVKPWTAPFDPSSRLVFGTGPLTGTLAPGSARFSVAAKNVFSNGVGSSNSGGFFAQEMKLAGFDHVIVSGRASKPVYICIRDGEVELRDALHVWGKTTWETEDTIAEELHDNCAQLVSIGPAGENLVRAACIVANKNRAAARCGVGAVMGSKRLKAIAVSGTGSVEVADPEGFMRVVDEILGKLEQIVSVNRFKKYGTHGAWLTKNKICGIPYKYFQDSCAPNQKAEKLDPEIYQKIKVHDIGYLCPFHCSKVYRVDEGPYAGLVTEGFELNTSSNFGGRLAIDEPTAIIKGHALCNQLGLDEDNVTGVVGWALYCLERNLLSKKDLENTDLDWGKHEEIFDLFRKIAFRNGIGDILAEGSRNAADLLGVGREYAMTMKGQDLYEETRLPTGWGLGACVAARGGGHTQGSPSCETASGVSQQVGEETYGVPTWNEPTSYVGKAKLVLYTERMQAIMNSLVLCIFFSSWKDPLLPSFEELTRLYSTATGLKTTKKDLINTADRILNIEKAFNVLHANLGRSDDYPPTRSFDEPIKSAPFRGFRLSKRKYDEMLSEYYQLHNWDPKTGLQTEKSLMDLGMKGVAKDLQKMNKLKQ